MKRKIGYSYLSLSKILNVSVFNGIRIMCCIPADRKISHCQRTKRCNRFFSEAPAFLYSELAELEGIKVKEIDNMDYDKRNELIEKYEKEAYKKCRKIVISVEEEKK